MLLQTASHNIVGDGYSTLCRQSREIQVEIQVGGSLCGLYGFACVCVYLVGDITAQVLYPCAEDEAGQQPLPVTSSFGLVTF